MSHIRPEYAYLPNANRNVRRAIIKAHVIAKQVNNGMVTLNILKQAIRIVEEENDRRLTAKHGKRV